MIGTLNRASNSPVTSLPRLEEAERMIRNEDGSAPDLAPPAADNTARWIAGTAVYQVGRNSFSQPKTAAGSNQGEQTTHEPADRAETRRITRPFTWNRGSTLSKRS